MGSGSHRTEGCAVASLAAALVLLAAPLGAQIQLDASAGSDYVHRGFSRSGDQLAASLTLRGQHRSGFWGALAGSSVSFDADDVYAASKDVELRISTGYTTELTPRWFGTGYVTRYEYPGAGGPADAAYWELSLAAAFQDSLRFEVSGTDSYLGGASSALFTDAAGKLPLPAGVDLELGAGRAQLSNDRSYLYGHVALLRGLGPRLRLQVGHYWSDAPEIRRWGEALDGDWIVRLGLRLR